MNAKLRGWLRLPSTERCQLALLLVGLPVVSMLLATAGYGRTRRAIERCSPQAGTRSPSTADVDAAERLAQLAALAGAHGPAPATCLRQALLTHLLLRRKGFDPELQIGGRRQDGRFDAHAWVELEGRPLGQTSLEHHAFQRRSP